MSDNFVGLMGGLGAMFSASLAVWLGYRLKRRPRLESAADRSLQAQLDGWQRFTNELQERISALEELDKGRREHIRKLDDACFACEEKNRLLDARNRQLETRISYLERRLGLEPGGT